MFLYFTLNTLSTVCSEDWQAPSKKTKKNTAASFVRGDADNEPEELRVGSSAAVPRETNAAAFTSPRFHPFVPHFPDGAVCAQGSVSSRPSGRLFGTSWISTGLGEESITVNFGHFGLVSVINPDWRTEQTLRSRSAESTLKRTFLTNLTMYCTLLKMKTYYFRCVHRCHSLYSYLLTL